MCCQVWESLTFFVTCSFHKVESRFLLNWTRSNIGWRPKNIPPGDPERRPTGKEDKSFFLLRKTGDANYWKASPDKKYPKMGLFLQLKNREQDLLGKEQPQMTCENSASSNGHTWVFVHRAGNKTPFIQSKTSKWWLLPDVLRPKKKKKAQCQANEVCLFLWHFVRSSLNRDYYNSSILIRAPTTMAPTHHGEKLRKLWG